MTRITHAVERRFVVPGRAVSFRSPHSKAYKKRVRKIARPVFTRRLTRHQFDVFIDYFHASRRIFDMDNVAKCILDSLTGIAYLDDLQVRLQSSQAHDLNSQIVLEGGPVDLVKPLEKHSEYLFVRVRETGRRRRKRRQRFNI